ncbi:MAG: Xaa-Pro dipeptidyl-peptidase [Bacillus sp. (in: firmicutes)]
MRKRTKSRIGLTILSGFFLLSSLGISSPASAKGKAPSFPHEETKPIYSYEEAIRETIYVESKLDTDQNGEYDRIAVDIIRPKETDSKSKVPIIMDASPYYESMGRGNESEIKDPDNDGINEKFPLYYDNYFVPRGYAVALPDMVGTNHSDGCPKTGGPEEIESIRVVIDWLNGKGTARDKDGKKVKAAWSNGKVGMIGKSYDGTLANGVAATGVKGLKTIVPIGAISDWYNYYRSQGLTYYNNGPGGLANRVASSLHKENCREVFQQMNVDADDATGDYNSFWNERNYVKDAKKVKASVFAVHGLNDFNVKMNHFSNWWEALSKHHVPRKLWLTETGHVDPFDFRRAEWVDTLHDWFDYWLMGIDNGIMDEPAVDIERGADRWETHAKWPDSKAKDMKLRFAPGESSATNGLLQPEKLKTKEILSFTDNPRQTEQQMVTNETKSKSDRLVFLTEPLTEDIRISGVPEIKIKASLDKSDSNLTALLVDYGTDTRIHHEGSGEGIETLTTESCWGESTEADDACYKETKKKTHTAPYEVVTRSWFDPNNWKSIKREEPLLPGKTYTFEWDMLAEDYVFKKGHRIGVIIAGSDYRRTVASTTGATFELSLGDSYVTLPVAQPKKGK